MIRRGYDSHSITGSGVFMKLASRSAELTKGCLGGWVPRPLLRPTNLSSTARACSQALLNLQASGLKPCTAL